MKKMKWEDPILKDFEEARYTLGACENGPVGDTDVCYTGPSVQPGNICNTGSDV